MRNPSGRWVERREVGDRRVGRDPARQSASRLRARRMRCQVMRAGEAIAGQQQHEAGAVGPNISTCLERRRRDEACRGRDEVEAPVEGGAAHRRPRGDRGSTGAASHAQAAGQGRRRAPVRVAHYDADHAQDLRVPRSEPAQGCFVQFATQGAEPERYAPPSSCSGRAAGELGEEARIVEHFPVDDMDGQSSARYGAHRRDASLADRHERVVGPRKGVRRGSRCRSPGCAIRRAAVPGRGRRDRRRRGDRPPSAFEGWLVDDRPARGVDEEGGRLHRREPVAFTRWRVSGVSGQWTQSTSASRKSGSRSTSSTSAAVRGPDARMDRGRRAACGAARRAGTSRRRCCRGRRSRASVPRGRFPCGRCGRAYPAGPSRVSRSLSCSRPASASKSVIAATATGRRTASGVMVSATPASVQAATSTLS